MSPSRAALYLCLPLALACGGVTPTAATATHDPDPAAALSPGDRPTASEQPLSAEVAKGVALLEANDLAGAGSRFEAALKSNPADADALYYLGALAEKAGDAGGAESSYKAALGARPGFTGAEVNLSALYDDAQRYDDALAITTPGLAQHPKEGSLHLNAGIAYGGKKDGAAAVREFDAAVAIAPRDATFRLVYGHWLAALGDKDAASKQLAAAVPLAAKNVGVLAAIGHELHVSKAFAECVGVLGQAIALQDAAELWTERAACKIGQQDAAGALADLRAATTKDAAYAPAHYYLGNELAKGGQFAAAVVEYQAFLKLEPNGPLAKGVAEKIRLAKQHGGR